MTGAFAITAENSRKHAALGAGVLDLRNLAAAGRHCVELSSVASRLADQDTVLEIELRQQEGPDVARTERRFHDPNPSERVLPLARQFADCVRDSGRALRAVKLASNNVAMHLSIFPGWRFNLAPDAGTNGEPLYIAKEKHRRLPFCSTPVQTGDKLYDSISGH